MQTFLTHRKHMATAAALDMMRLGKQRANARTILQHLLDDGPMVGDSLAYEMWVGWEGHLAFYGMCMAHEWGARGFRDNTMSWFKDIIDAGDGLYLTPPPWMDDLWLLRSHRSNLVRKAPHLYAGKFPNNPENMPYLWPVNDAKGGYYLTLSSADLHRLWTFERTLPNEVHLVDVVTGRIEIREHLAMDPDRDRLDRRGRLGRHADW